VNSKDIFNGLKWASIELMFDSIMKFALKLLLAKLLLPEDFGLIGMCLIFIGITQAIAQMGMNAALIQKKSDSEAEKMYDTAFWTNLGFSIVLYIVLSFGIAPFVSYFYEEPILTQILPYLSLPILIQPFSLIPTTILTRKLDFKSLTKSFNLATMISGIIAVLMAYYGYGVWALITNQVLAIGLAVPTLYHFTKWAPKLTWNRGYFKEIFNFGIYSTGTSLTRSVMGNVDKLIIGKMMGKELLGAYTLAITLTEHLASFLVRITNKVIYPVFSHQQDEKDKLRHFYLLIMKVNAIMVYPIMFFLICFAEEIIVTFFGENWVNAILPLKIIAVAMIVNVLSNGFDAMLRARGKPKMEFKIIALVNISVLIPLLFLGSYFYGMVAASLAIPLNSIVLVTTATLVLKKEIELRIIDILKTIKSAMAGGSLGLIIVYSIKLLTTDLNYLILMTIFIISYTIVVLFLERIFIRDIIKRFIPANSSKT
jgi:O-antigen/teichoic acid export membrane protein